MDGGAKRRPGPGVSRRDWLRVVVAHCSGMALAAAPWGHAAAAAARGRTVLVVGDSLSAEYGLARGSGWVALLERRLGRSDNASHRAVRVINASISGDTTAGGRARLPELLRVHAPSVVVIELGGNDALRGLPLASTRDNLAAMVRLAKTAGAHVLLAGMQVPPNYGRRYSDDFAALFAQVAQTEGTSLVPFLLARVADGADPLALFQPDRIHPTAEAHPIILDNVWPALRPLLD